MKITKAKIKRVLIKNYGWGDMGIDRHEWFVNELIKDVLTIIDAELKVHKGISIK